MTVADFRAMFPAFASVTTYTDAAISACLAIGEQLAHVDRWGEMRDRAVGLCAAHYLTFDTGGAGVGGVVASKSVGAVSVSYDTSAGILAGAGQWNQTIYGRQYISLARLICAGCVQL